ncbi:MAG: glutathione synthase [Candidatus Gastranaerophilales bacterium]|nr:glutathione synthase [Candidatus Gastranaerophilales bacterium]
MSKHKIAFILDRNYFSTQYLEPDTSFFLMKECCLRGMAVYAITADNLFLNGNKPEAIAYRIKFNNFNLELPASIEKLSLNELDMILFRVNPPITMNYIFLLNILDYIDQSKVLVINSPSGIKKVNEKLYINNFADITPKSLVSSNLKVIKDFIKEIKKTVIKPLNNYGGNGIFYLKSDDKNQNSIIETATNSGETPVLIQEYLDRVYLGDKRIVLLGKEPIAAIVRIPPKDDFRANMCRGGKLQPCEITDQDREICKKVSNRLINDGIFFAGLDIIDNKLTEINVTSPGFFIRKINPLLNIRLEEKIVDYMESFIREIKDD